VNGHDDSRKKVIHATICAPGAESLRAFCVSHGVTITAFIDGLGHVLTGHSDDSTAELEKNMPTLLNALGLARHIDADRRSREPNGV